MNKNKSDKAKDSNQTKDNLVTYDLSEFINEINEKAKSSLEIMQKNLEGIAVGRATPMMLHSIKVTMTTGSKVHIHHIAAIEVLNPNTLSITPFDSSDKSVHPAVARAVTESSMGLSAYVEGSNIIIKIPSMTEERKYQLRRAAHQVGEDCKQILRNMRNDITKKVKEIPSKDDQFRFNNEIDKRIKFWIEELVKTVDKKSADIN